jgi:hypothetical protein
MGLDSDSANPFTWLATLRGEGPTPVTVSGRFDYNFRRIAVDERYVSCDSGPPLSAE